MYSWLKGELFVLNLFTVHKLLGLLAALHRVPVLLFGAVQQVLDTQILVSYDFMKVIDGALGIINNDRLGSGNLHI